MRTGARALAAALVVVALSVTAASAGSPNDRVTGGGQTLIGTTGAGNTIAFTAQGNSDAAKGQVQVVDRSGGTGQAQTKFHGIVDCLTVDGSMAEIYGHKSEDPSDVFAVYVVDNGEGAMAENDIVALNDDPKSPCEIKDDDDKGTMELGRGNAQVYDAP
jgi:hypothetical protein